MPKNQTSITGGVYNLRLINLSLLVYFKETQNHFEVYLPLMTFWTRYKRAPSSLAGILAYSPLWVHNQEGSAPASHTQIDRTKGRGQSVFNPLNEFAPLFWFCEHYASSFILKTTNWMVGGARCGAPHCESLHSGGRGRGISELEAKLVYRVSSRTGKDTQRNPV